MMMITQSSDVKLVSDKMLLMAYDLIVTVLINDFKQDIQVFGRSGR